MLIGHGPSKISIIEKNGRKYVKKTFSGQEQGRFGHEYTKMLELRKISQQSFTFDVPKIVDVGFDFYTMEYLNAVDLNKCGFIFKTDYLKEKLLDILKAINCVENKKENVWPIMREKFYQLQTTNEEYNILTSQLPVNLTFNEACTGYSHGDLTFDNILIDGTKFYLIDPAWSKTESPLWDVGKLLQSILIRWNSIKKHGHPVIEDGWLTYLCYSISQQPLLESLIEKYELDAVILATACQLSRVSRWCYADVLIPLVNELLRIYFSKESIKQEQFITIVERTCL